MPYSHKDVFSYALSHGQQSASSRVAKLPVSNRSVLSVPGNSGFGNTTYSNHMYRFQKANELDSKSSLHFTWKERAHKDSTAASESNPAMKLGLQEPRSRRPTSVKVQDSKNRVAEAGAASLKHVCSPIELPCSCTSCARSLNVSCTSRICPWISRIPSSRSTIRASL
jgi:hypothetical protein